MSLAAVLALKWGIDARHRSDMWRAQYLLSQRDASLREGDYIPSIPVRPVMNPNITGDTILPAHGSGLLYLFSTTCHYCNKEKPLLSRIQADAARLGYSFTAVQLDYPTQQDVTAAATSSYQIFSTFTVPLESIRAFRVGGTPTFAVVTPTGRVSSVLTGYQDEASIIKMLH